MKKLTRILIVLSLLAILASVIMISAFAATTTIDKVYVTLDELEIGKALPTPVTDGNADYYISHHGWNVTGPTNYGSIVQDGYCYTLIFYIKANGNKTFDENTVLYLNGVEQYYALESVGQNEYSLHVTYRRSFKTVVETVSLTYDEFPAIGSKTADYVVLGGNDDRYGVHITINPSERTTTFEEHIYYDVTVRVSLWSTCEFSENTVLIVNGVERSAEFNYLSSSYDWRYQIVYGEPIDEIVFPQWYTDIQPGHSGDPVVIPGAEDTNYTVTAVWKTWGGGVPTTLVAGDIYYLYYEATSNPGYYFADDAVITMEGAPVEEIHTRKRQLVSIRIEYGLNVEYLDQIDITYVRPRIGDEQDTFKVTCENVSLRFLKIYRNKYNYMIQDKTFLAGETYYFTAELKPQKPCAFADTVTITFNGENPVEVTTTDRYEIELRHDIEYARGVEKVEFPAFPETVTPGPGGITDMTAPEGATYTIKQAWIDMRTGQIVEAVEAGDIYTLAYMAEPKPGYVFDENTKATLGGENCEVFTEDRYMVVYRSYDLGAQKLDRVDITLPQLYKGCTPGAATVPQGANYTLMELIWAESTTESFEDSQPVEAVNYNTNIFAFPVLCAGKGYTFTEDTKLFFNGVEVPVVFRYAEGPMMELAGLYGTLTPPTTGWAKEDNTWAYYQNGQKQTNRWMKDSKGWVYLDRDGHMVKNGWAKDSKGWCYMGADGYMVKNRWAKDSKGWCYLDGNGYMVTSRWIRDSKDWCYVGADGYMMTDAWIADSAGWCYVGHDGYMIRNGWAADSKGICYLGANGYITKNRWINDGYGWAYVDSKGYAVENGWVKDSIGWCYIEGYYMVTDVWVRDSKGICRVGPQGYILKKQWVNDGYGWAYVDANGYAVFNQFVKDEKGLYFIGSEGYMLKGGWIEHDGKLYYAQEDGRLLRNTTQKLGAPYSYFTYTYKFDSNGVATMVNPW